MFWFDKNETAPPSPHPKHWQEDRGHLCICTIMSKGKWARLQVSSKGNFVLIQATSFGRKTQVCEKASSLSHCVYACGWSWVRETQSWLCFCMSTGLRSSAVARARPILCGLWPNMSPRPLRRGRRLHRVNPWGPKAGLPDSHLWWGLCQSTSFCPS